MSAAGTTDSAIPTSPHRLAVTTRVFGWTMLLILLAWLVNAVLNVSFGWPGVEALFNANGNARSVLQISLYILSFSIAVWWVSRRSTKTLRQDGKQIAAFNAYLIRAAFFAVLLVGIGDAILSFLRVEDFLEPLLGKEMSRGLGRSQFRGTYFHVPLLLMGFVVALFTRTLGFVWLSLLIVAAELLIVITRFIFSYEQAFMGDLVRFWYAALFLFASAYTLQEEGHVRVDVFYAGFTNKTRGAINAVGTLLLGMSLCWTILVVGLGSKSSIIYAPIRSFETSQQGYGMYVKYMMAGFLAVFAITMLIQFVSYLFQAVADYLDDAERIDHDQSVTTG